MFTLFQKIMFLQTKSNTSSISINKSIGLNRPLTRSISITDKWRYGLTKINGATLKQKDDLRIRVDSEKSHCSEHAKMQHS